MERIEISSMFFETNYFFKFERIEYKAWKHSAEKYRDQTVTFTLPSAGWKPFYSWVCLLLTFALGNLILRWLMDSHMTIFSKSNYCVRLNVNMNIADDTISLQFNFGKGCYFVLRVKQQTFHKAWFFWMNNVNLAIANATKERMTETCSRRSLSF